MRTLHHFASESNSPQTVRSLTIGLRDDPHAEIAQAMHDRLQIDNDRQEHLAELARMAAEDAQQLADMNIDSTAYPFRAGINYRGAYISLTILLSASEQIDFHPAIFYRVPAFILEQVKAAPKPQRGAITDGTIKLTAGELEMLGEYHALCNVRPITVRSSSRRW